jgi:hypothetical protein
LTTHPPPLQVDSPNRRQTRRGYIIGGTLISGIIVISIVAKLLGLADEPPKSSVQTTKDETVRREIDQLYRAGQTAVSLGDAIKSDVSGWNSSLDLTIGTRSTDRAEHLADFMCHRFFGNGVRPSQWKVRVYLVDGSETAECKIN